MTAAALPHRARRAADSAWTDRLARFGLCARGVVYGIVGVLALQVAQGGRTAARSDASKEGALRAIAEKPLGTPLLLALAVGAGGYAVWRATDALWGKTDEEDERKRAAKRMGSAAKAVLYAAFTVTILRFAAGERSSGRGGEQEKTLTARVLDLPLGQLLVGAVGVALLVGGVYVAYRGLAQKFEKRLDTSEMGTVTGRAVDVVGTIGLAARGLVFSVAGYLVLRAALEHDPSQATGLDGTLRTIARQSFGQVLLAVTAVGIIAYGVYSFVEARYREL